MGPLEDQLVQMFASATLVASVMRTKWGWPICESLHFIGLSLLIGMIGSFDLRLLGIGRRIPIAALHRLVPFGVLGYALNVITGSMFLMTEPDQYFYNPSFHFKLLFMALAGINVLAFYLAVFPVVKNFEPGRETPRSAKLIAAMSLGCWIGVIVCGRLLTFYRPGLCEGVRPFWSTCIPGQG